MRRLHAIEIVLTSIAACAVFGIVHDQVTARIAVEHFTVFHPKVIESQDPTALALVWGVLATWWVGLLGGLLLAGAARLGSRPKRSAPSLRRPLLIALAITGACAAVAGVVGHALASSGAIWMVEPYASRIPKTRHVDELTVMWVHGASYLAGAVAFVVLAVVVWRSRRVPEQTAGLTSGDVRPAASVRQGGD